MVFDWKHCRFQSNIQFTLVWRDLFDFRLYTCNTPSFGIGKTAVTKSIFLLKIFSDESEFSKLNKKISILFLPTEASYKSLVKIDLWLNILYRDRYREII